MKRFVVSFTVLFFLGAVIIRSNWIHLDDLFGIYCAEYPYAVDKIQLNADGSFYQQVLLIKDSTKHEVHGSWRFDPNSDYISIENRALISDGFGKMRHDFPNSPKGTSVLPVRRSYFIGEIGIGSTELVPYVKSPTSSCNSF